MGDLHVSMGGESGDGNAGEGELSPRERRQLRTSQAILEAARHIVQHEGMEGLSMRAIADRIDYSPATLYEYYGSKDEIVQAVCRQGHIRLRDRMAEVDTQMPILDYVVEIGLVYIRFAVENPDYFQLMFSSTGFQPPAEVTPEALQAELVGNRSSFSILLRAIQQGIDEGVYKPKPGFGLLEMAYGCWSLVHGLASLRIVHDSRFPVDYVQTERQILMQFGIGLTR